MTPGSDDNFSGPDQARSRLGKWVLEDQFFELYDRMFGECRIPDVLRPVTEVVCHALEAERTTIYLVDHDTMELESVALIGNVVRAIRVPIGPGSLAGYCALSRRAFVVPDAYGDLSPISPDVAFDRSWDDMNNFRTRDVMNAPVLFRDDLQGVVQVINSRTTPFEDADLPPLRSLARMIGYALYNAKLYDDLATMKQLEKEKAGFMRIMVHELKSPVAASKMMTQVLAELFGHEPKITKMTGRIASRLDQMTELVTDMLSLAQVKQGGALGDVNVLDLRALTEAGAASYREQAELKGLEFALTLPAGAVPVRFDSKGYELVLSNLLSNAVKYTTAGRVSAHLTRDGDWAVLAVSDSGIGIPEADIPELFREFFRASNARKSRIQGSGVGLAGVKEMVDRFGGTMTLTSRENEGSTFTVRLPLAGEGES